MSKLSLVLGESSVECAVAAVAKVAHMAACSNSFGLVIAWRIWFWRRWSKFFFFEAVKFASGRWATKSISKML